MRKISVDNPKEKLDIFKRYAKKQTPLDLQGKIQA